MEAAHDRVHYHGKHPSSCSSHDQSPDPNSAVNGQKHHGHTSGKERVGRIGSLSHLRLIIGLILSYYWYTKPSLTDFQIDDGAIYLHVI